MTSAAGVRSATRPWLAYYGDDFTGSTDVMEVLQWFGLRTVLFMSPPTAEDLNRYPNLAAIGVAGTSRSMSTEEMRATLPSHFEALRKLEPSIVHYKTCSTFDSSPAIGSIGAAIEIGQTVFGTASIPVIVGAPHLGRYQAFGNLFARSGANSPPYRLDRHPTMSRHPTTPMHDADLRRVLAEQTVCPVSLIDVVDLANKSIEQLIATLDENISGAVLFDAIDDQHLQRIGEVLHSLVDRRVADHQLADHRSTQFVVGSSGVQAALTRAWPANNVYPFVRNQVTCSRSRSVEPILVISGSCSPVSQRQLESAEQHGFASIAIPTDELLVDDTVSSVTDQLVEQAVRALRSGQSVILHTSRGPADPRIAKTQSLLKSRGMSELDIRLRSSRLIGPRLGDIVYQVHSQFPLKRLGIAGGDSSGHIVQQLQITSLEAIAPITPGAPLCRASGPPIIDGLELILKGGQVGPDDLWVGVRSKE